MDFKSKLYNITKDLEAHKRSRLEVLSQSIETRLNFALQNYDKAVADSYNYLVHRNSLRVMKKINRRK
jgi:hypothetical protein